MRKDRVSNINDVEGLKEFVGARLSELDSPLMSSLVSKWLQIIGSEWRYLQPENIENKRWWKTIHGGGINEGKSKKSITRISDVFRQENGWNFPPISVSL